MKREKGKQMIFEFIFLEKAGIGLEGHITMNEAILILGDGKPAMRNNALQMELVPLSSIFISHYLNPIDSVQRKKLRGLSSPCFKRYVAWRNPYKNMQYSPEPLCTTHLSMDTCKKLDQGRDTHTYPFSQMFHLPSTLATELPYWLAIYSFVGLPCCADVY